MAIENEELFVEKYTELLLAAWRDDAALGRILTNPAAAAAEFGLPVDAGATVRVDRSQPENLYTKDEVVRDWTATAGVHILHIPRAAPCQYVRTDRCRPRRRRRGSGRPRPRPLTITPLSPGLLTP
ncbi:hypothetical protein [Frankia sp. Cas3]|uniref:hypothetical protein n=1 Tax=Frankia sp. Cas3 TaxID=3073926 RepID=UPI002AD53556|nr:hypothetical protein [Frankia sp. Cas3]